MQNEIRRVSRINGGIAHREIFFLFRERQELSERRVDTRASVYRVACILSWLVAWGTLGIAVGGCKLTD